MSCDNKATSFLLVGAFRQRKQAIFIRRQNMLLIFQSQPVSVLTDK
jgi:hypothetical protein